MSITLLAYILASCVALIAIVQFPVALINSDQCFWTYFDLKTPNIYNFVCKSPSYTLKVAYKSLFYIILYNTIQLTDIKNNNIAKETPNKNLTSLPPLRLALPSMLAK